MNEVESDSSPGSAEASSRASAPPRPRSGILVKIWITALLVLLFAYGGYSFWRTYRLRNGAEDAANGMTSTEDHAVGPAVGLADFEFIDTHEQPVSLKKFEGKVWAVSFFFASCPGACKLMNQEIERLEAEYGPQGVKFVSVTTDPKHDTPERLAGYAEVFGAKEENWLFLTGRFEDAQALGNLLKVTVTSDQTHSDRLVLIDRAGVTRGAFSLTDPTQRLAARKELDAILEEEPMSTDATPADITPESTKAPDKAVQNEATVPLTTP